MRRPVVTLALLLAATACTDGAGEQRRDPNAELQSARARLATLARATANGSYDAQYRFVQQPSNMTGVIRIWQAPPQYRIDIISKDGASFFALSSGIVSCSSKKAKKTCFLVAKPGEPVPGIFDPGVQRLFRDAVEDLAANPGGYIVTPVETASPVPAAPTATPTGTGTPTATPTAPATPPVVPTKKAGKKGKPKASPTPPPSPLPIPQGECFRVERVAPSPEPGQPAGFEDGTYCFAEQGVATSITVSSGTLTLVKLHGPPPKKAFEPPATVQRLPELTPSPTATPKKRK